MTRITTAEKHFWVIAYDIAKNSNRTKVADLLEQYGVRRNFSVFEILVTPVVLTKIKKQLQKLADTETDTLLYYYICKSCYDKKEHYGKTVATLPEEVIVI
jgi:CRISPR-associated protein Cas2